MPANQMQRRLHEAPFFHLGERKSFVTSQTVWAYAGQRTELRLAC